MFGFVLVLITVFLVINVTLQKVKILPNCTLGVGKLRSTQFMANLELRIVSKVTTHKISLTLNNFKDHISLIWASKLKEIIKIMNMKLKHNCTFV
jgi:hypothetical protein